nr:MAG TPA: hypothetical protein [Caudoviricetes sp.]
MKTEYSYIIVIKINIVASLNSGIIILILI